MSRRRAPAYTKNTPEALASVHRVRITNRISPCGCGCQGADSWHRVDYDRVVRDLEVLDEPEVLFAGRAEFNLPARHIVARGWAKFPSGRVEVRATVQTFCCGTVSPMIDWERVR